MGDDFVRCEVCRVASSLSDKIQERELGFLSAQAGALQPEPSLLLGWCTQAFERLETGCQDNTDPSELVTIDLQPVQ